MRAESANLNNCAVPFISRAAGGTGTIIDIGIFSTYNIYSEMLD